MKKLMTVCLLALFAMMAALPASALAAETPRQHTITVTGHAETSVAPDVAVATFGVLITGTDVETAKRENDRIMHNIYEAMLVTGIDRSKVKTSMFSIQPVFRAENNATADLITGYRVQNTIAVTIEDMSNVSRVIDAAFNAGANQFQGIRFSVKKEQSLRDELLRQALLDGKAKAQLMAETLGEKLGRPVAVNESGHVSPVMLDNARFTKSMAASTPISAGLMTASADVQLVFELIN